MKSTQLKTFSSFQCKNSEILKLWNNLNSIKCVSILSCYITAVQSFITDVNSLKVLVCWIDVQVSLTILSNNSLYEPSDG